MGECGKYASDAMKDFNVNSHPEAYKSDVFISLTASINSWNKYNKVKVVAYM